MYVYILKRRYKLEEEIIKLILKSLFKNKLNLHHLTWRKEIKYINLPLKNIFDYKIFFAKQQKKKKKLGLSFSPHQLQT